MPVDGRVHDDRDRAESFGAVAADYDRYRPSYPAELIDDLVAVAPVPHTVLDIGCGTGKAATLFLARGLDVLGVEPDPAMAAVARGHGVRVEDGHFETWVDGGRRFDLIVSGQAWHWVDPAVGTLKAARLLHPGGRVALFWNFGDVDERSQAVIDAVYAEHAPELSAQAAAGANPHDEQQYVGDMRDSGAFAAVDTRTYPWTRSVAVEDWVNRTGTQSQHLLLGAERLAGLQNALRAALLDSGEYVEIDGGTYTILAAVDG